MAARHLYHLVTKNPNLSEVEVFTAFVANLSGLQKQLDKDYQQHRYLRDRLLTAIDIRQTRTLSETACHGPPNK